MDAATFDLRAAGFTPAREGGSPVVQDLHLCNVEDECEASMIQFLHVEPAGPERIVSGDGFA